MRNGKGKGIRPGSLCLVIGFAQQQDWNGLVCTAIKRLPVGHVTQELFLDSSGNSYAGVSCTKTVCWGVEFQRPVIVVLKSPNSGNVYHSLPDKYQQVPEKYLVPLNDPDAEDTTPAFNSNPLLLEGPAQ